MAGVCVTLASGVSSLLRARTGPPGARETGAGVILIGRGAGLGALRTAEGWTGAAREATASVGLLLILPGMLTSWAARKARGGRRSAPAPDRPRVPASGSLSATGSAWLRMWQGYSPEVGRLHCRSFGSQASPRALPVKAGSANSATAART